ncbi:MAG: Ig-like domain-containing protein [Armatimonadetes bacterium]|nr:Ig-like domain-containing protein [Armatimonadota bacterium]
MAALAALPALADVGKGAATPVSNRPSKQPGSPPAKTQSDKPSGIIIDARALDLGRQRFPKLFDPQEKVLYPSPLLSNDPKYMGFVGYKPGLQAALDDTKRIGRNPLVIRPAKVHGDDPVGGSLDLDQTSSDLLASLNRELKLLDDDRLLIVIGLSVVDSTPAANAADVAADSPVAVVFSKPLSDDSAANLAILTVVSTDNDVVGGKVTYDRSQRKLVFTPGESLKAGVKYTVTVSARAEAESGATLEVDHVFSFTVKSAEGGSEHASRAESDNPAPAP